jgi:hypothetical protein
VERPTAFDSIIDKKVAEALGLTIPLSMIAQATELVQ